MNKALGVVTCAISLLTAASDAEAARHRFWGGIVITAASAGCPFDETNNKYGVRFRPAGLGDGDSSTISIFTTDSARNFRVEGQFLGPLKTAAVTDIFDYASIPSNVIKIRFSSQAPATVSTSTLNITATGVIVGWDDVPTCRLDFRMTVTKRVES